jgi:hypothetical protein
MAKRYLTVPKGENAYVAIYGREPLLTVADYPDAAARETAINSALNWYRNNSSKKDLKKYSIEYAKKNSYSKEQIEKLENEQYTAFEFSIVGGLCRISNRGFPLTDNLTKFVTDNLLPILQRKKIKEVDNDIKQKITVQDRIVNQVKEYISELERYVDCYLDNLISSNPEKLKDLSEWIREKDVKSQQSKMIADWYRPKIDQIQSAIDGDEIMREGYCFLSMPKLRRYGEFFRNLVNIFDENSKITKAVRKPRAKKKKSPDKQVAKLKYLKEYSIGNRKLTSIDPRDIIGASKLVVFNTKYNKLTVYEKSSLVDGFSVKGCTLIGYDEKNSSTKKIRKPESFDFNKFLGGARAVNNTFKDISTKESLPNGRFNEHVIIIQAIHS